MWIVLSYDPEAACGSFDANFKAFGPYRTSDEAEGIVDALSFSGQPGEVIALQGAAARQARLEVTDA